MIIAKIMLRDVKLHVKLYAGFSDGPVFKLLTLQINLTFLQSHGPTFFNV